MINKELDYTECLECLEELKPKVGRYGWMINLLRMRSRQRGGFPVRVLRMLRRIANPKKPYFIGTTADGTKFMGDFWDDYSVGWAVEADYDGEVVQFLKSRAAELTGTYLDIGANCAILAATVGRKGRGRINVVVVEAMPATAKRAAATLALNKLEDARLFTVALGHQDGEIELFEMSGNSGWASAYPPSGTGESASPEWRGRKVECRRLDSLAAEVDINNVCLMKVDVEGHEFSVFRGAEQTFKRDRPELFFEYNPMLMKRAEWTTQSVHDMLKHEFDYELSVLSNDGILEIFPPKKDVVVANIYGRPGCKDENLADDRGRRSTSIC